LDKWKRLVNFDLYKFFILNNMILILYNKKQWTEWEPLISNYTLINRGCDSKFDITFDQIFFDKNINFDESKANMIGNAQLVNKIKVTNKKMKRMWKLIEFSILGFGPFQIEKKIDTDHFWNELSIKLISVFVSVFK
jgi:hypothetical protein